jgi:hypothetical protein
MGHAGQLLISARRVSELQERRREALLLGIRLVKLSRDSGQQSLARPRNTAHSRSQGDFNRQADLKRAAPAESRRSLC